MTTTLTALLLLLLSCGYLELSVAFLNRFQSFPFRPATLHRGGRLHQGLFLLGAGWMFVRIGWLGPGLLGDGSWNALSTADWCAVAVGAAGVAGALFSSLRWHCRRPPDRLLTQKSRVVDIAAELGTRPTGPGDKAWQLRLPGSECFLVDLAEKTLSCPHLPPDLSGLRLLHLSDFHFRGEVDRPYFEAVARHCQSWEPDLIVFTGDLLDNMDCLDWTETTFGALTAPFGRFFVLGNHDWYQHPQPIREQLIGLGWQDLAGRTMAVTIRGDTLLLGGDETPWMGDAPPLRDADTFRILVSHTPDNVFRARRERIPLVLAGHTHGGQVVLPVIGPVYSPSRSGTRFAAGTFQVGETLLHVSRGLSGEDSFRWRCVPEVTLLTLRAETHFPVG